MFALILRRGLLLLLTFSLLAGPLAAQSDKDIPALELGKPIERELAGGQSHLYRIALVENQFLRLVVVQRGIDVVLTLFSPAGERIVEQDSPNGLQGPEEVLHLTGDSGDYRLEVRALKNGTSAGRYEVKIEELHWMTERDSSRFSYWWVQTQISPEYLLKSIEREKSELQGYRASGNMKEVGRTLDNIALLLRRMNDLEKAIEYYSQALLIYKKGNDREKEAQTLLNMALSYGSLREDQKELDLLNQALDIQQGLNDPQREAEILKWIGLAYDNLGEPQQALSYYNEALRRLRSITDRHFGSPGDIPLASAETGLISSIISTHQELGEYQKALTLLNDVLRTRQGRGDSQGVAETHIRLADIYSALGKQQDELDHLTQALRIYHDTKSVLEEGRALARIAVFYYSTGDKQKALDSCNKALQLARSVNDILDESYRLYDIGTIYLSLGDKQKAADSYDQALRTVRSTNISYPITQMYERIGRSYFDERHYQKSIEYFSQMLQRNRAERDSKGESVALFLIALAEINQGKTSQARYNLEAALEIVESLRTKVVSPELRASSFAKAQSLYDFYIYTLMRLHRQHPGKGYDADALQASERARARSLLELLAEARADIRQGVDPKLVERERALQQQLNARAQQQVQLLSGPRSEEQANAIAREIERLTIELQRVEAQIRQTSPRYAALTQPRPLSLREIQTRVLDADTLLLEYSLGKYGSYLWAVTPTSITSYELPKQTEIEAAALQFRELLTASTRIYFETDQQQPVAAIKSDVLLQERLETAARLSRLLLGPVASQLGRKRLVVVADGALQYLPFAALPDPASLSQNVGNMQPLIMQHEVVSLPSISVLATLRSELAGRKPAPKDIAALADPVFYPEDERVSRNSGRRRLGQRQSSPVEGGNLTAQVERDAWERRARRDGDRLVRLKGTRKEAQKILALVPANRAKLALDFDATRALAVSGELGQYRHVLFATHGRLDDRHPGLSSIVLSLVDENGNSQNGYLRLNEVYNLKLPAEVVTLSGCETGLGKEVRGEGLVGLTRGLMYAGAARVVVSLWKVDDEATAELMVRFYRGMLREGKRPADALRAAQIELMRQRQWKAPHYWAAFVLQGEWK